MFSSMPVPFAQNHEHEIYPCWEQPHFTVLLYISLCCVPADKCTMLDFAGSQLMYIWVPFNFAALDILGIFLWVPDARISVRHLSQGGLCDHRTCSSFIRHCQAISLCSRTSSPPQQQWIEVPAHTWCYQPCSQSGGVSWYLTVVLYLHFPKGRWHWAPWDGLLAIWISS